MPLIINTIVTTLQNVGIADIGYIATSGGLTNGISYSNGSIMYNYGFIFNDTSAIIGNGKSAHIENYGSITGGGAGQSGVIDASSGVVSGDTRLLLVNHGSIATQIGGDTSCFKSLSGGNLIINYGNMSSSNANGIDILNIINGTSGNKITNNGFISSSINRYAVKISNNEDDTVINNGDMIGAVGLYGSGLDVLRNSGMIDGNVDCDSSIGTTIRNAGLITGTLDLGSGSDFVDLRGGKVLGGVQDSGGSELYYVDDPTLTISDLDGFDFLFAYCSYTLGNGIERMQLLGSNAWNAVGNELGNSIFGNALDNALDGAEGDDTIEGRKGQDTLIGGDGNDTLNGGTGHDTLNGDDGNDSLRGEAGDDILNGGSGNDNLIGAGGNDSYHGGLGRDNLSDAGEGSDTFIYRSALESGTTAATRDKIGGFVSGEDVIDLAAIDANVNNAADSAFTLVGAFTGVAGQLVFSIVGSDGILSGDINGDSTADFSIQLNGVTAILATDLIL